MIAAIIAALAVSTMAKTVHDMVTLSYFLGIVALPIMLAIHFVTQHLYSRSHYVRESVMREEDERSRNHVVATLNLCRSLIFGIEASANPLSDDRRMVIIQHIAEHVGIISARYGHILSANGRGFAIVARDSALYMLKINNIVHVRMNDMTNAIDALVHEVLDLDDPRLVDRRRFAAETGGSTTEWDIS